MPCIGSGRQVTCPVCADRIAGNAIQAAVTAVAPMIESSGATIAANAPAP